MIDEDEEQTKVEVLGCPSSLPRCCDHIMTKSKVGEEKSHLVYRLQTIVEESQGRNSRTDVGHIS